MYFSPDSFSQELEWQQVSSSLFKSPTLFSLFRPVSVILSPGCSSLVLLFLSPLVPLLTLWWLPRASITIGIIVTILIHSFFVLFFLFSHKIWEFISLLAFCYFYPVVSQDGKAHNSTSLLLFWIELLTPENDQCKPWSPHRIHCWWGLIRSKQLSCVSVCRAQVFTEFSGHSNLIPDIIPQLKKKENIHLHPFP